MLRRDLVAGRGVMKSKVISCLMPRKVDGTDHSSCGGLFGCEAGDEVLEVLEVLSYYAEEFGRHLVEGQSLRWLIMI